MITRPDHQLSSAGQEVELGAERDQRPNVSEGEVDLCGGTGEGVTLTAIHPPKEGPLTFPALPTPTSAGDIMLGPQPAPPPLGASTLP